jgi:hypothetical protein
MGKWQVLTIVAVVVGVIILFLPVVPVDVPYTTEEPFEREMRYVVLRVDLIEDWHLVYGVFHRMEVEIENVDVFPGRFDVVFELWDIDRSLGGYIDSHSLMPGETHVFSAWWDTDLGQDVRGNYIVTPSTVIDRRLVTRYRTEYKSIFQIIR